MRITEPSTIRALAHPLRLDLLELLAASGPATAAQCGRMLKVPQANCSFHLRQLAKYGFVQEAVAGDDKRERKWQVRDPQPRVRVPPGIDAIVRRQFERVVVERDMNAILDVVDRDDEVGSTWRQNIISAVTVLSVAEAADVRQKIKEILEPYIARTEAGRTPDGDERHVRYFMAATPLTHFDQGDDQK
jgi:DNA-binding transcriptional ArsR family regulator